MKITWAMRWKYAFDNGWVDVPYRYVGGKRVSPREALDWLIEDRQRLLKKKPARRG